MRTRRVVLGVTAAAAAAAGGVMLAARFFSAPKYRGPRSDHFDGERFLNLQPTHHAGFRDMVRWLSNREQGWWAAWRHVTPAVPSPHRIAMGGEMRVTFVNHATLLIQTETINILTDPIWSERCSPVSFAGPKRHHPPGIRFEDLPPIDVVLISHNHYDHMDVPTLKRLVREHHPRIITGLGNGSFLEKKKIGRVTELDWWESVEINDAVRVNVVPAQHFSSRGSADRDANLWCGFVIETPHGPVYFAGDTGWGGHFDLIRERFGPARLAMLPIGAYRPEWFMCPVHISPREAVRAAQALEAKLSIPMHYGTFHLGDDGMDEPVETLMKELVPGVEFHVLAPGASTVV